MSANGLAAQSHPRFRGALDYCRGRLPKCRPYKYHELDWESSKLSANSIHQDTAISV